MLGYGVVISSIVRPTGANEQLHLYRFCSAYEVSKFARIRWEFWNRK